MKENEPDLLNVSGMLSAPTAMPAQLIEKPAEDFRSTFVDVPLKPGV
ncbi:hypothetical protein [Actinomadura bangladeshensis]|nr:hypothetical protein [Actinomadura bangladeshensis]